jgi:hypothetical protein
MGFFSLQVYSVIVFYCYFGGDNSLPNYVSLKGKAIPLQAWTGPEGSRRLKLPDFKTVGT